MNNPVFLKNNCNFGQIIRCGMTGKYYCYAIILLSLWGCTDELIDLESTDKSLPVIQRMNDYTKKVMTSVYLWADEVRERQINENSNPESYFNSFVFRTKDHWSYMDNSYRAPSAGINGFDDRFGYDLTYAFYGNRGHLFARICYVYPNTPAARAGLKRGDIILKNNGEWLDLYNYEAIYKADAVNLELGTPVPIGNEQAFLQEQPGTYSLNAQKTSVSPILAKTILRQNGRQIAYLHYTEFANDNRKSLAELSGAIREFKDARVDEFILDLRYNRGGFLSAARHLCSLLAPLSSVRNGDVLIYKTWNKEFDSKSNREEHFDKSVASENINLSRLYVIVSSMTASASELLISGLRPYIPNTILIGEKTAGKYVGSQTYRPDDNELNGYALHPIVFAYQNALHESVEGGMLPDYQITEDPFHPGTLGDPEEPLLKATLALIAGRTDQFLPQSRSAYPSPERFTPVSTEMRSLLINDLE